MSDGRDPAIITGGMGIWISCWVMSRIVSMMGGMGIVSGTALDIVYARLLQDGDPGGHVRRAFAELVRRQPALALPVNALIKEYFIEGGKPAGTPYKATPNGRVTRAGGTPALSFWEPSRDFQFLTIAANFAEVWLAKEGHDKPVGINYLRKVERPLLWGLYGAMLAGVNYVAIGAGSPSEIPAIIRSLSEHKDTFLKLRVYGTDSASGEFAVNLRPEALGIDSGEQLPHPKFLAIVSSLALADALYTNPETRPYGFIIEGAVAGGHNAPPGKKSFSSKGEPTVVYTEADRIDVKGIGALGLPFWLAGDYGSPEKLQAALDMGATGVQFGTLAALSGQSGLAPELRLQALRMIMDDKLHVTTEARTSPSGFPFKVAQVPGTLSDPAVYNARKRICDIGFLQSAYVLPDGNLGFRCPAESPEEYVRKGGKVPQTTGRVCLCNGLLAAAGFPQTWANGYKEPPIVTLGDELSHAKKLMESLSPGQKTYSIGKALKYIAEPLNCKPSEEA
jgi:NAD(P)H-dependent flavin oxidoreductase YrpB (nitropropane dioxygenase family)